MPLLRYLLAYAVLPNLAFLIVGHTFVFVSRPVVNADYFLAALIAPFIPVWARVLFYGGILLNDLIGSLGPIYHFQIADVLSWLTELSMVGWSLWVPMTLMLLAISFGGAYLAVKLAGETPTRLKTAATMTAIGVLVCVADIANGTSFLLQSRTAFVAVNIAYSGGRRTLLSLRSLVASHGACTYTPLPDAGYASSGLLDAARAKTSFGRDQLALILVESMSLFKDPAARAGLVSMFREKKLSERYDIRFEDIPFEGHTINGEFRELCGVRLEHFGIKGLPECLPKLLKAQGYESVALHGFSSEFYDRDQWYPRLGFDRILFADELYRAGVKEKCGASFAGLCDTSVAEKVHQELLSATPEHRKFVYWMTLNSHLPLNAADADLSHYDCASSAATSGNDTICAHTRMVHLVLERVADLAADPKLPPTRFVIVGDHMVPFMQPARRELYDAEHVPAVILTPKALTPLTSLAAAPGAARSSPRVQ